MSTARVTVTRMIRQPPPPAASLDSGRWAGQTVRGAAEALAGLAEALEGLVAQFTVDGHRPVAA